MYCIRVDVPAATGAVIVEEPLALKSEKDMTVPDRVTTGYVSEAVDAPPHLTVSM